VLVGSRRLLMADDLTALSVDLHPSIGLWILHLNPVLHRSHQSSVLSLRQSNHPPWFDFDSKLLCKILGDDAMTKMVEFCEQLRDRVHFSLKDLNLEV
jgi:hypothetical protein